MLTSEKEMELMRLYFNGQLKGKELKEFEQKLKAEEDFQQRVFVEKMVFEAAGELFSKSHSTSMETASLIGLQKAKKVVDELEDELFEGQSWEDIEVDIDVIPTYTLQELLDYFKPIEHFESANKRSNSSSKKAGLDALVLTPQNEVDCTHYQLNFQLKEALYFGLELTILNNEEDILHTQIIEANTLTFTIYLDFLQPKVGKYYWRLKANTRDRAIRKQYKSVIRSFFLNKGLNPYS